MLLAIALLFSCLQLNAQSLANLHNQSGFRISESCTVNQSGLQLKDYYRRKHCWGVRAGKVVMVIGGAELLICGLLATAKREPGDHTGFALAVLGFQGVAITGLGGMMYGFGRMHERNYPERFSIIGNMHQIGLAYRL